jgi:hypothetical protein
MQQTTRQVLQERQSTPLALSSSEESLNSTSLANNRNNVNTPVDNSKPLLHSVSGCNTKCGSMSPKHSVFVLDKQGKPLTPTTIYKSRKLLEGGVATPIWNKFGQLGIQMLVDTRKETPKTALGIDFGTKFEGYAVTVGNENNLSVMWKLPDKKQIVKKLEERRILRRARRWRTCRRRECRFDNRVRKDFLAPSQRVMVQSRLKSIAEFFRCYPIDAVAIEDVRFNHSKHKWGKNFSTVEIGKTYIYNWLTQRARLHKFTGYDTSDCRERYGYKKSNSKSAEVFNAHCSDALSIATDLYAQEHIEPGKFIVVDDTYRPVRRKLHDSQYSKGHIRHPYSAGNFKGVRKGVICELGLIAGGTGNSYSIYPTQELEGNEKRIRKSVTKITWLSHKFKAHEVNESQFTTATRLQCPLAT